MADEQQISFVDRVQYSTVDPTVEFNGGHVPALTTLLVRVCDRDPTKFEEACRLVGLFIEQALVTQRDSDMAAYRAMEASMSRERAAVAGGDVDVLFPWTKLETEVALHPPLRYRDIPGMSPRHAMGNADPVGYVDQKTGAFVTEAEAIRICRARGDR